MEHALRDAMTLRALIAVERRGVLGSTLGAQSRRRRVQPFRAAVNGRECTADGALLLRLLLRAAQRSTTTAQTISSWPGYGGTSTPTS